MPAAKRRPFQPVSGTSAAERASTTGLVDRLLRERSQDLVDVGRAVGQLEVRLPCWGGRAQGAAAAPVDCGAARWRALAQHAALHRSPIGNRLHANRARQAGQARRHMLQGCACLGQLCKRMPPLQRAAQSSLLVAVQGERRAQRHQQRLVEAEGDRQGQSRGNRRQGSKGASRKGGKTPGRQGGNTTGRQGGKGAGRKGGKGAGRQGGKGTGKQDRSRGKPSGVSKAKAGGRRKGKQR